MAYGLIGLVAAVALAQQAPAEPLPGVLSVRELAWRADTVVAAVPVDRKQLVRFKVQRVLRGRLQPGQEIQVEGAAAFFPADGEVPPAQVLEYCLFLTPDPAGAGGEKFQLVPTGLACLSRSGETYRPTASGAWGGPRLHHRGKSEEWDGLLSRVQSAVEAVQRLQWARNLPASRGRNQALLDWVQRHRREFQTEVPLDQPTTALAALAADHWPEAQRERGWGELERQPLLWVLESGVLPDCWRAIELYAEIRSGACLGLKEKVFGSREGRAFLARIAGADDQLDGSRRRALRYLATQHTLRGKSALDAAEQTELLERFRPLLQARSAGLRSQAARTILEVSRPLEEKGEFNRKALPELIAAYKAEAPGGPREALAEAVRNVASEKEWQELTGQPLGLAAAIQAPRVRQDKVCFWLVLHGREVRVTGFPILILERLDPKGKVLETKREFLPASPPQQGGWVGGWDGSVPLLVELDVQVLEPGSWRLRAEGESGKERQRWQSEPRLFKVALVARPDGMVPVDPKEKAKMRRTAEVSVEE